MADVFPFVLAGPAGEPMSMDGGYFATHAEDGKRYSLVTYEAERFTAAYSVLFPQTSTGLTLQDLEEFWRDHLDDPFLLEPKDFDHAYFEDTFTAAGVQTVFYLSRKHVKASSLVVTLDGSPQAYTLQDNDVRPSLLISPAVTGDLVVKGTSYVLVLPAEPRLGHSIVVPGNSVSARGTKRVGFSVEEVDPGDRFSA